ncbi:MAG: glycosyltransferase [Chitinophagaceae bacterium]|nr:glycosyltransferase [Chitinophagaceae bacterium]
MQNPVVFFVHGDYEYYYQLAVKHFRSIDVFICVSASITNRLKEMLPAEAANIQNARFPVPYAFKSAQRSNVILQLIFVGRCEEAKGYYLLTEIERKLEDLGVKVAWHIAGEGSDQPHNQVCWPADSDVYFYGKVSQSELSQLLLKVDLLVLPSLAEGMPVSIVEAMKAEVVPIVNNLPGGIQEIVINGTTGYKIDQNLPAEFAIIIKQLNEDQDLLHTLRKEAASVANRLFDPLLNTNSIEAILLQSLLQNKSKSSFKTYGSRLDQRWIPNVFVNWVRIVFRSFK